MNGISEKNLNREIFGFNWIAFLFTPFWAIANGVWIGLASVIPYVGVIVHIYMGIKGNELAYSKFNGNREEFYCRKLKWGKAIILGILLMLLVASPTIYTECRKISLNKKAIEILNDNQIVRQTLNTENVEDNIATIYLHSRNNNANYVVRIRFNGPELYESEVTIKKGEIDTITFDDHNSTSSFEEYLVYSN